MTYVVITPARNEANFVPSLYASLAKQTVRPALWVFVDGGSSDGTYELVGQLALENEWIRLVLQARANPDGYSHLHFAEAVNEGLAFVLDWIKRGGEKPTYVGKVDATVLLDDRFFEEMVRYLDTTPDVAFACGTQVRSDGSDLVQGNFLSRDNFVGFNDNRLYRLDFLTRVGGYPKTYSPDTVLLVKALQSGVRAERIHEARFVDQRPSGTKIGTWDGYVVWGRSAYFLGYSPSLVFLKAVYQSIVEAPHFQGVPMLCGYFASAFRRRERIHDDAVRDFFGKERLRQVLIQILRD